MKGKSLHFFSNSIAVLFRKSKIAFLLYLLVQIVVSLGFVFFFTTVFTARKSYFETTDQMRDISVDFPNPPSGKQVEDACKKMEASKVVFDNIFFTFREKGVAVEDHHRSFYSNYNLFDYNVIGSQITQQMVKSRENVLVVGTAKPTEQEPNNNFIYYPKYQVGDFVEIQGEQFQIIGYRLGNLYFSSEIPYTTGLEKLVLSDMTIRLPHGFSDNEKEEFGAIVASYFHGAKVKIPPPLEQKVTMNLILPLSTSVLVGLSAVLSFLFLFQYMLESIRREYQIFHVCGASIKVLMTNLAAQLTLLFTLCFAVGTALFVLFRQIFITSEFFEGTALSFSQVGVIYLISLVIILLMALPFLFRFRKQFRKGGGTG